MTTSTRFVPCAALALALSSGVALAQPAPGATQGGANPIQNLQQAEARTHFQQGVQHYQNGEYDQAITEFRAAQQLFPAPVILFNLAQAYRAVGWLSEATATFRRYLAEAPGLTAAQRREVQGVIQEIEANRAVLAIEVEPAGATLTVDGRTVGTLPLARALELLPGEHTISVRLENYEPRSESVALRRHERRLFTATLRPEERNARLTVTATPADATIRIDDREAGTGRVTERVAPGEHTVAVAREGYVPHAERVRVGLLASESVSVALRPRTRSILTRPAFWAVVGGVLAAGVVVYILANPADADPIPGNGTPPVVQSVVTW